ncbi:retrotransposon protein, putative, ty1-copia subclass [Tanacetum coccineum]
MLFTMRETYVDRNPKSHKVLGIAQVAIIDRQLPFEYTITSRSTDVVVMAQPVQNINHSAFRSMFEREKLSGTNFNDWLRRLKLVLRVEKKMFVIEQPIPPAPAADSEANVLAEWNAIYDAYNEVACLMLGSMTPELHRQFENYSPYDMLQELKSMFEKQAGVERFDLIQTFHACKQEEGKPVGAYVLKMKDYVEQLERLGYVLPQDLSVGLILNGLTSDFTGFVRNYNMHNMGKTIGELHAMLIEYEKGLLKKVETPQVMMIKSGKIQKANKKSLKAKGKGNANGKGKNKQGYIPKPKNPKPSAKEHQAKDDTCHHCKEVGHWKRNCLVYLAELEARKLKQGALCLYVGNGVRAQVEAIRSFDLVLPNGLVICVDNCHYAPSITRGVVSVHRLVENGFVQCFTDFGILVSKNNVHYFNAILSNGIYEIDMHDLHCRLAYISKKRIEKLQQEGLLKSTDDESFDQCVSCLSGKMTRKSFPHRLERVTGLLGIIHTDVFKNEVENQLGKTIMALRSDRGGEYISQEFKDYLKASLPLSFWDYALEPATRILNMVPTKKALVKRDTPDKLQQRSVKCIFIGYPKETMGYYFYFPPKNKIVVARYAEFFEKNLITQEVSGRVIDLEEIQDEDTSPSEITSKIPMEVKGFEPPQEEVIRIRRSERTHQAPNHLCQNVEVEEHSLGDLNEPTSYKAAMLDSKSNKWIDAMNAEIQSMIYNMVWVLVDLPPNCKTIRSKWIFKKKTNMDGIVHTYKARLVAKGYTQLYGVDYEETFSPVADIRAIRILISIAVFYDYEIWQMDVKTAFLNGYLDEDIYMQASRSWNKRFDEKIKRFGFAQNLDEPCVYQKANGSNVTFLILLDLNKTQGASTPKEVKRMQNIPYASAVGSIMYAVRCTRPDVAFAQNITSQFQQNPGAVDWKSSKQSTTAMSATEAEYIAAMEAVWIRKFISGLGIVPTINEPIRMFYDNSAALHFVNEPVVQRGARHYHKRYHYVRESIALGEIRFLKVHTYDNLADPFTKALLKGKVTQHARSMGLSLASSFM